MSDSEVKTKSNQPPANADASRDKPAAPGRRRAKRVLAVLGICLALCFLNEWRPWEPRFQGKTMSAWIEQLGKGDTKEANEAETVLLAIGVPAVPGLIWMYKRANSPSAGFIATVRDKLSSLLGNSIDYSAENAARRERALDVLALMGPAAKSALPIFRDALRSSDASLIGKAALALNNIIPSDEESVEALIETWHKTLSGQMKETLYRIWLAHPEAAIPQMETLIRLTEADWKAIGASSEFTRDMAQMFQIFGTNAAPAAPLLRRLRDTGGGYLAAYAESSLWAATPEEFSPDEKIESLAGWIAQPHWRLRVNAFNHYRRNDFPDDAARRKIAAALKDAMEKSNAISVIEVTLLKKLGPHAQWLMPSRQPLPRIHQHAPPDLGRSRALDHHRRPQGCLADLD
jgi:hypothetical protein